MDGKLASTELELETESLTASRVEIDALVGRQLFPPFSSRRSTRQLFGMCAVQTKHSKGKNTHTRQFFWRVLKYSDIKHTLQIFGMCRNTPT